MVRDIRKLRDEAHESTATGKYKRALAAYLDLERLEPRDAQWSKRAGETYRRLGRDGDAIEAYARGVDRYAQGGFLVQAIALCKLILQIDPKNSGALGRIAEMNELIGAGPSRAVAMADHNPALADNTAVAKLRRPTSDGNPSGSFPAMPAAPQVPAPPAVPPFPPRGKPTSTPPIAMS